jgi:replicative DNA helicase
MRRLPEGTVAEVLESLGIESVERNGEHWALCPNPNHDDTHPSWSANDETGVHLCFACGYKGNIVTLLADLRGQEAADRFRSSRNLADLPLPKGYRVNRDRPFPALPDRKGKQGRPMSVLALFVDVPDEHLEKRRLTREAVDAYGVLWDGVNQAWVLPFFDPDSLALVGYQLKYANERKFINVPPGMSKADTLFGYPTVPAEARRVVVVESPLDAVRAHSLGFAAVAVCGSRLSVRQAEMLQHFDSVVFALDNDEAGRKEHRRLRREFVGTRFSFAKYNEASGKDFGEMTDDEVREVVPGA